MLVRTPNLSCSRDFGSKILVTLLSIWSTNSVGVPLSPTFPAAELRYILENSGALMLLSSVRFQSKAEEVLSGMGNKPPIASTIPKRPHGPTSFERIQLETITDVAAGMMLYTSGTTNRPVGND